MRDLGHVNWKAACVYAFLFLSWSMAAAEFVDRSPGWGGLIGSYLWWLVPGGICAQGKRSV